MESNVLASKRTVIGTEDPLLREMVDRLVQTLDVDRIYLFGSRARGNFDSNSDYDLMVLVNSADEPLFRLSQRGYRALRGIDAAVDVVVWARDAFDRRTHVPASFPATVVREGHLLHGA